MSKRKNETPEQRARRLYLKRLSRQQRRDYAPVVIGSNGKRYRLVRRQHSKDDLHGDEVRHRD
jgi:hypothetical protein